MNLKINKKLFALILIGAISVIPCAKAGQVVESNNEVSEDKDIDEEVRNIDFRKSNASKELVEKRKVIIEEENKKEKDEVNIIEEESLISTTTLNIRKEPNSDSEIIDVVSENTKLDFIESENDEWNKIKFNDQDAYVSKKYTNIVTTKKIDSKLLKRVYLTEDSTLYENDSLKNSILDIPRLEVLDVYKEKDGLYLVQLDNNIGYVKEEGTEELKDTYVVVDLSDQELKLYKDNKVILTSPVVTGKPSTPTNPGDFEVYEKTRKRWLLNPDGSRNVFVDVMMKFDGNRGLHDAGYDTCTYQGNTITHGWRSSFGGSIYKYNGSHGCVNMPHDEAMETAEYVEVGTKVLVKN